MTVREFIAAIPKVELNLQLTGAFNLESLLMIARQNGVPREFEHFEDWLDLLDRPDYTRLDEIARVAGSWVRYPEDIARVVYDVGVVLSKQNVRYAELVVAPSDFMDVHRMGIEVFIDALNDGRDRARRGWNVDMSWIFCIPRDNPRVGDDVARWATGATARRGNVVALGLLGQEDAQPVGQFRRAFATARKKDIFTTAHVGSLGAESIAAALEELNPHRLTDSWGIHEDEAALAALAEAGLPVVVSISRALRLGLIGQASDYPLRQLFDSGLPIILSSGMPALYQTSMIDEYMMAHDACGLEIDAIIELAKRSIAFSYMDEELKKGMLADFEQQVIKARSTLLNSG